MGFILPEQSAKACRDSASLQEQKNPNKTEIVSVETTPSRFLKERKKSLTTYPHHLFWENIFQTVCVVSLKYLVISLFLLSRT